jgi:MFS family permease
VAGLSGTALGLGLALIRLASLGALPLGALADKIGRRQTLLGCAVVGLAFTFLAAFSPGYVWFVALFALGRPFLSAVNVLAIVFVAEHTYSHARARAVAVIGAAYGVGAGTLAVIRGAVGEDMSFRILFGLALIPLALVPVFARNLHEPERFDRVMLAEAAPARMGFVPRPYRSRLILLCLLTAALGAVTGPANTFVFFFGESVKGLSSTAMALAVLASGPLGFGGLVLGRWIADHVGRRIGAAVSLMAIASSTLLTYGAGQLGVLIGYPLGVMSAGMYAPNAGALNTESFPTSARATTAGWLTASNVVGAVLGILGYGLLVDALHGFGVAMACIALPTIFVALFYVRVPETRGLELEESAPEV